MTTLIRMGGHGTERRCDAKCYNATAPACDCVCQGRNHGKGLLAAAQNTYEIAESVLINAVELGSRAGVQLAMPVRPPIDLPLEVRE